MGLDQTNPRDAVIAAGRERMLMHGIDALRSQLNASVLSAVSPVSRDTAYRVFRDDRGYGHSSDAIVAAVSRAAHDPAWGAHYDAIRSTLAAELDDARDLDDTVARVKAALQANFEHQFSSPSTPVTWLLLVAAFTGSPSWTTPPARSASFADDFVDNESRVVATPGVTPDPARLVRDLVTFASQGSAGWPIVEALLRSIGHVPGR